MRSIGLDVPQSGLARTLPRPSTSRDTLGFPLVIRPSFTLGGVGGGIAYNIEEFREIAERGLELSPVHEVLIEESVIGWKEFELEVMRDVADNFVVICSIENIDPMGVHTGDSITVAPILTLSDKEYQRMRDAARRIIRKVGVETGGSNIQFAVNPGQRPDGGDRDEPARVAVVGAGIEGDGVSDRQDRRQAGARLSPRRDSQRHHAAHARLVRADHRLRRRQDSAVELREVSAGRPDADDADEVGGRGDGDRPDVQGSFMKGVRSLELGKSGLLFAPVATDRAAGAPDDEDDTALRKRLAVPHDRRMWDVVPRARPRLVGRADSRADQDRSLVPAPVRRDRDLRREVADERSGPDSSRDRLRRLKRAGFGDAELALAARHEETRRPRAAAVAGLKPVYKRVDTCAAEFESFTPYLYSSLRSRLRSRIRTAGTRS